MSLSRYYKSSTSFQPEELVKQDGSASSGWIPSSARSDDSSFLAQQFTAAKDPSANSAMKKTAPPLFPPGSQAPINSSNSSRDDQNPPENQIDLSNYLELAVAEKQREEAYRRGIEKGREEGYDKAEQDFGAAARSLLFACQQMDTLRQTIIANSSGELLDFTLAIAERILRISVQEQDSSIVATIEEALLRAVKSDEFSIFIHPDDYAAVSEKAGEIIAGISGLNNIVVRKDKTIERGGAKIESDNCTIDATIASQFDLIREEVKKLL